MGDNIASLLRPSGPHFVTTSTFGRSSSKKKFPKGPFAGTLAKRPMASTAVVQMENISSLEKHQSVTPVRMPQPKQKRRRS
jgi:hypothetical protein